MGTSDRPFTYTDHAPLSYLPEYTVPDNIPKKIEVHSEGIYQGLPSFPAGVGGTALIAGANGISGTHMMRTMAKHPEIWRRVHGISRRPPNEKYPDTFTSHAIDLSLSPVELAKRFKEEGITQVDYVCWYVFSQKVVADKARLFAEAEMIAIENGQLFDNFLQALLIAGLKPKRVLLQTGGKGYGQHWGPYTCPAIEDDIPRARFFVESNFYFSLQDLLLHFCRTNGVEWCESRPGFIVGVVKDNNLNFLTPLLLYAAITKHMGKKELVFPSDRRSWNNIVEMTTAYHMAFQQEWQLLAPHAGNQIFHTNDGCEFGIARLFPLVASFYGLSAPAPPSDEEGQWKTVALADQDAALGYPGVRATSKYQFLFSDWVLLPEVKAAWTEMCEKYDLDKTLMDSLYCWSILDYLFLCWWPLQQSMAKSRKFGYFGTVDTMESIREIALEAVKLKIIPEIDLSTFKW